MRIPPNSKFATCCPVTSVGAPATPASSRPSLRRPKCVPVRIAKQAETEMTSYPTELDGLRWEKDASTRAGYLIFDRPPMNVVSFQARAQMAAIITAMDDDPDVRVIVIRGANGVYSSRGDIAGFLKRRKECMEGLHCDVSDH